MEYTDDTYGEILNNYKAGQEWLAEVTIEIEGGEAPVAALTLLRAYEKERTVDNDMQLAALFIQGRTVIFRRKGKVIKTVLYTQGDLSAKFNDSPFLLDLLLKWSWAVLLKKLTPPSADSESEESGSDS